MSLKDSLYFLVSGILASAAISSCRQMPREADDTDTVPASVFEPPDTIRLKAAGPGPKAVLVKDSAGLYYVGFGSTHDRLQLVSYPSRRDTLELGKAKYLRVKGSADYDHVVRPTFFRLKTGDSIVSRVEEFVPQSGPETAHGKAVGK